MTVGGAEARGRVGGSLAVAARPVLLIYAPLFAVALTWCVARLAGYRGLAVFGSLPGGVAMGLAAWQLYRASRATHLGPAGRRFWRRLAVAAALIAPSTSPMTEGSVFTPRPRPVMIIAVSMEVMALLLVLWALLRLPVRDRGPGDRLRLGLDAATVLVGAATFLWYYMIEPVLRPDVDPRAVLGMLVLCLVCLLAVLAVVKLVLAGTDAVDAAALRTLATVVLLGAVASSLSPLLDGRRMAGFNGVITTLEAMITAFAGLLQYHRAGSGDAGRSARRRAYSVLPYIAVAATDALLLAVTAQPDGGPDAVVVGAVVATAIVAIRQLLAFRDNAALVVSLQEHQRLLREQATHDALTGLPNRALFNEMLEAAFRSDQPGPLTAFLIDLDDFKAVNDTLGHGVGDGLLIEVGRRLRSAVRHGDLVARLGGDEFAVLLPGTAGREALGVATRILTELGAPVSTHGHQLMVGASVGVAERDAGDDPQALLRHADIAMYAAKRRGKGNYARYTPGLGRPLTDQGSLVAQLRRAIDDGQLLLVYQPIVRLADGVTVEFEALARWQHPRYGVVAPDDVIPVTELGELAVPLGHRVLAEACRAAAGWKQRYGADAPGRISVGVAGQQLRHPHFVADVAAVLARTGLPPHCLMLEVTSSAILDDERALIVLHDLRELGVELALDGFGTKPSSLDLLITVPVTRIKFDVSFLGQVGSDRRRNAVAVGVAHIAREAGLDCVATGVETAAHGERLRALGYSLAQGLNFSPPVGEDEVGSRLAAGGRRTAVGAAGTVIASSGDGRTQGQLTVKAGESIWPAHESIWPAH